MTNIYRLFVALFLLVFALPKADAQTQPNFPTFDMTVRNIATSPGPNGRDSLLFFDVYMQQTNFGQPGVDPFEFCCAQYAWLFNRNIASIGSMPPGPNMGASSLTASAFIPNYTALLPPTSAVLQDFDVANQQSLLQFSGNLPNSSINYFISSTFPGTFMMRVRMRTTDHAWNVVPLNLRFRLGAAPNSFVAYFLPFADTVDTEVFPPPAQFAQALMDTVANVYSIIDSSSLTVINLKATFAPEGKYNSLFNLLTKRDSVSVFLRRASAPFNIIDSSRRILDSITFSNTFTFINAESGRYYIVVKHYQCIETWSKSGGDYLVSNGPTYDYDFTSNSSQAYGNNLKLKGSKFCIYSGDLNQDGFIRLEDMLQIHNDIVGFTSGNTVTDLNGDKIVDLSDLLVASVNAQSFVSIRRP